MRLIEALVFLLPATILIVPGSGEVSFGILAIVGLVKTVTDRHNPLSHSGNNFFALISWSFFLVALLSVITSDRSLEGFQRLGTSIHFLVAPFIGVSFASSLTVPVRFFQGIKAGAIAAGMASLGQYYLYHAPGYRPHGTVNAIVFADIAVLLAFFSMVCFFRESKSGKIISGLSCFFGLLAAFLSETRGAWVAVPILLVVLSFIWWIRRDLTLGKLVTILSIFGVAAALVLSTQKFQERYQLMVNELKDIDNYSVVTAIRERVVMWKSGQEAFFKSPILGHGLHNTNDAVIPYIQDQKYRQRISGYSHLHNEIVTTLVGKGIIGLVSLLLLLFGPVFVLWKYLKSNPDSVFAAVGVLLCTGYFLFGMTGLSFGQGIMNTFYAFMLSVIFYNVTLGQSKDSPEERVAG